MSIDLLAFSFDAEKQFGVRVDIGTFFESVRGGGREDATVRELFDWLSANGIARKGELPADAWPRFVGELRKVAWDVKRRDEIRPEQWLRAELGLGAGKGAGAEKGSGFVVPSRQTSDPFLPPAE